jgi:hypothetical protein
MYHEGYIFHRNKIIANTDTIYFKCRNFRGDEADCCKFSIRLGHNAFGKRDYENKKLEVTHFRC